ncbi:MAG: hypothetical protein WCX73_05310 [Candidatus Pacearchaeota archaeon]|jgi:hypothetical protein
MNKYTEIAEKLLKENNITVRSYRKNMSGLAYIETREIIIPHPNGKISFLICLHEIAHILNGHIKPKFKGEYLAEKWAMDTFRELGFRVPQSYIRRAKRYVRHKVHQAKVRGLKKLGNQSIYNFIKQK